LINRIEGVNFITAANLGSCNVGGHTVFITHHILSSCCIDYKQYTRIINTIAGNLKLYLVPDVQTQRKYAKRQISAMGMAHIVL